MLLQSMVAVPLLLSASVATMAFDAVSSYGVRATGSLASEVIAGSASRSPTVRTLIDDLSKTDLIVYVSVRLDRPSLEGRTVLVSATAKARYVRVDIDVRLAPARRAEVLAHELYHALEIAAAPEVRDEAGMRALFTRIGWQDGDRFETAAAQAVERWVRGDWWDDALT